MVSHRWYQPDFYKNRGVAGFDRVHNFQAFGTMNFPSDYQNLRKEIQNLRWRFA